MFNYCLATILALTGYTWSLQKQLHNTYRQSRCTTLVISWYDLVIIFTAPDNNKAVKLSVKVSNLRQYLVNFTF